HRLAKGKEALFRIHLRLHRRRLVDEMRFIEAVERTGPSVTRTGHMVERDIARGTQQEGARIADVLPSLGLEAANERFLQHVFDVVPADDAPHGTRKHAPAGKVDRFDAILRALAHDWP